MSQIANAKNSGINIHGTAHPCAHIRGAPHAYFTSDHRLGDIQCLPGNCEHPIHGRPHHQGFNQDDGNE
jgi:hypothetical protein